jgi:hypothetical protein
MLVPENWDQIIAQRVDRGQAFFPICYSLHRGKPLAIAKGNGRWRRTGLGMCGFTRKDFDQIGGWSEHFTRWGLEDNDIYERATRANMRIKRWRCPGLFHQWHPKKLAYKERYH